MSLAEWTPLAAEVELRVLGPMQLGPDHARVALGGRKQRAVLAALALQLGRSVSADELVDLLWSTGPQPSQPRRTLQVYVANLRKLLRPHTLDIAAAGLGYRLVAGRSSVDAALFADLVAEASELSREDPERALALHEEAAALWRGRALSDLADEFVDLEEAGQRLDEQRLTANELRLGLAVRYGDVDRAVAELAELVDAEPWRERAVASLMIGCFRQGRQADALAVATTARSRLVDELGLEPSPLLRETEQDILEQRIEFAPRVGGETPRSHLRTRLPSVSTEFVGREVELARLVEATTRSRLVTLVGTGGVGKSRLAVEAAQRVGLPTVFVALVSVDGPGVGGAVLEALDLPVAGVSDAAVAELLGAQLGDRPAWILLDNAEHVLDRVSAIALALLRGAPTATIVVTSRAPLAAPGEAVVEVAPLDGADARQLFADRAALAGHRLDLTDTVVRDEVDLLCTAVDGLPLAIELAANRLRVLQLPEMIERIADRFAVAGGAVRSDLSSHATMLDTIAWSYERLTANEQTVLQRLAMFPAGATAYAAEVVCHLPDDDFAAEDVIDLLAGLVDQSLVIADHRASPTRFRMLEMIRQFAEGRGASAPRNADADRAMWRWAERVTRDGARGLMGPAQLEWRHGLSSELDNIRGAFERAVRHGDPAALSIADELSYLRLTRGEMAVEAAWLREALAMPIDPGGGDTVARAQATIALAFHLACDVGTPTQRPEIDAALDALRNHGTDDDLLESLTAAMVPPVLIHTHDDLPWGMRLADEAILLATKTGDQRRGALAEGMTALALARSGRLDEASTLAANAVDTLLELGDEVGATSPMRAVWTVAWRQGDVTTLRRYAERSVLIERRHDLGVYGTMGRYWLAALATLEEAPDAMAEIVAGMAQPGVLPVRQAFQALRSMILRRGGQVHQARDELVASQPIGTLVNGVMSVVGLVERGWCDIELGLLDDAAAAFHQAATSPSTSDDAGFMAASLEGRAGIAVAAADPGTAAALLAEADRLRTTAPALLHLHLPEVETLRRVLADAVDAPVQPMLNDH